MDRSIPTTGAEALLTALGNCGVRYLFANAGTDFPPVIEGLARLDPAIVPAPVTVPHETASVAMAHGYWLVTGEPQAIMVHVNVGLANAVMGVINAHSDDVPVIVLSGRTPITETGRKGGRVSQIQYGQEMYDQASMVRDVTKFQYEIRYPEQGDHVIRRAAALAASAPMGPVYVSLPREPLTDALPQDFRPAPAQAVSSPAAADPACIAQLARWIGEAERPVVLAQRGDVEGRLGRLLSRTARDLGLGVAEPFCIRNLLASDDPALLGYGPKSAVEGADLVIVLDCAIPWIAATSAPDPGARIVHIGPDPLFRRMPVRGYRSDLSITADPVRALEALVSAAHMDARAGARAAAVKERSHAARARARAAERPDGAQISPAWLSRCVSDVMDETAIAFSELGLLPEHMILGAPNRYFAHSHSGGLGWAMPAALGAQLADRERLVIAGMGDGSYMFANPVACHQIAEALDLPILTVVKNNGMWNAVRRSVVDGYPGGAAASVNEVPLTSLRPLPDFTQVARASRAHAERVDDPAELPAALARAVRVIREEKRQALLDVAVVATDSF